jgi:ribosome biogenesis protein SSF1/2
VAEAEGILPHRLGLPNLYARGGSSNYFIFAVKKTKTENAAQKEWHTAREKLRKERREEQDRNVQHKRALAGKIKANAVGAADEEGTDDGDDDDHSPGDPSEGEDGGEASWDEEEEISEGEVSEDDDAGNEDRSSEDDDDDDKPPRKKKQKVKQ